MGESVAEAEFASWLRPRDAVAALVHTNGWQREHVIQTILTRLSAGLIVASAGDAVFKDSDGDEDREIRAVIPTRHWNPDSQWVPFAYFWESGDIYFDLETGSGYNRYATGRMSYFDVRFEPSGIAAIMVTQSELRPRDKPDAAPEARATPSEDNRPHLSKADAERFCRAILAGWGDDVKQDWAHEKAVLFFPDKRVPRDWFRSILRSIRGPMKPGKRGKPAE